MRLRFAKKEEEEGREIEDEDDSGGEESRSGIGTSTVVPGDDKAPVSHRDAALVRVNRGSFFV